MDPYDFEKLVAEVWKLQGYQTSVRQGSGDRGIDVEATKQEPVSEKVLIQAKCYRESNKIGSKAVREYATLYQQVPETDTVVIVTTSEFTSPAEKLAVDLKIKTVNGNSFARLVKKHQHELSKYIPSGGSSHEEPTSSKREILPTQSHRNTSSFQSQNLLNHCPECGEKGTLGIKRGLSVDYLKCSGCMSGWARYKKDGEWKEYNGPNEGKAMSLSEWEEFGNMADSPNTTDSERDLITPFVLAGIFILPLSYSFQPKLAYLLLIVLIMSTFINSIL
jgi:restriction system protein